MRHPCKAGTFQPEDIPVPQAYGGLASVSGPKVSSAVGKIIIHRSKELSSTFQFSRDYPPPHGRLTAYYAAVRQALFARENPSKEHLRLAWVSRTRIAVASGRINRNWAGSTPLPLGFTNPPTWLGYNQENCTWVLTSFSFLAKAKSKLNPKPTQ